MEIDEELLQKANYYLKAFKRGKVIYNLSKKDQNEIKEVIESLDSKLI